jgi:hypothetical protein
MFTLKFGLGRKQVEKGVSAVCNSLLHKYYTNLLTGKIRVEFHAKIVAIDEYKYQRCLTCIQIKKG